MALQSWHVTKDFARKITDDGSSPIGEIITTLCDGCREDNSKDMQEWMPEVPAYEYCVLCGSDS